MAPVRARGMGLGSYADRGGPLPAHVVFNVEQLRQHLEYLRGAPRIAGAQQRPLGTEREALQFLLEKLSSPPGAKATPDQVSF